MNVLLKIIEKGDNCERRGKIAICPSLLSECGGKE